MSGEVINKGKSGAYKGKLTLLLLLLLLMLL